jgi:hypothetical protein
MVVLVLVLLVVLLPPLGNNQMQQGTECFFLLFCPLGY